MVTLTNLEGIVWRDFSPSLLRSDNSNVSRQRIVLDPGPEHGQEGLDNFNLLRNRLGLALLRGAPSRFGGQVLPH